ncbi:MAG: hypothetical protein K8R25_01740 [Methanosarcinales archaeon]|nr:hypothetical protein [Methanosarcinales archaeon]
MNTGTHNVNISAEIPVDQSNFYNEALRLNDADVGGFSKGIPADATDFEYTEDITASLEVPSWAGGMYGGCVLFVAEND